MKYVYHYLCLVLALVMLEGCAGTNSHQPRLLFAPSLSASFNDKQVQFHWHAVNGATFYRLLESPDGVARYTPLAEKLTTLHYSHNISLHQGVNTSYILEACTSANCLASPPYSPGTDLAQAVGYVKATNTQANDVFGTSLALSGDGNTLAVGAPLEHSAAVGINGNALDNSAAYSGAVYVYGRTSAGTWVQQTYIKASNTGAGDRFGTALALSHDGNTLAVGALLEDSVATGVNGQQSNNGATDSGAVYVYTRNSQNTWFQRAYIKATNTEARDEFGIALSLSGDGTTLAIGGLNEDSAAFGINGNQADNIAINSGAVYVYERSKEGMWSLQAYIKASNTQEDDGFGMALALSTNGDILAVGAPNEDSVATEINGSQVDNAAPDSGAVYLYMRNDKNIWSQRAYIKATNSEEADQFGSKLALSDDGYTLAVGAVGEDSATTQINGKHADNTALDSGAVYVYTRAGAQWSQQAYIKAANAQRGDYFGTALSLNSNGTLLAVGARLEDSMSIGINNNAQDNAAIDSGAAYIYTRNGGTWLQQAYIKAPNTEAFDEFGTALALSGNGQTLAVGATGEDSIATGINNNQDNNNATGSGAVYLY